MSEYHIVQIGCGGTGGYLVPPLSKFMSHLPPNIKATYVIVDGDIVEERNVLRQNFTKSDIGKNKAQVLGERYEVEALDIFVGDAALPFIINSSLNTINIIVGCVDKVEVRLELIKSIKKLVTKYNYSFIYVDAGNFVSNGQVLVETFNLPEEVRQHVQSVDIASVFKGKEAEDTRTPTCSVMGDQSILANFNAALHLYNIITTIVGTNEIITSKIVFTKNTVETNTNLSQALLMGII